MKKQKRRLPCKTDIMAFDFEKVTLPNKETCAVMFTEAKVNNDGLAGNGNYIDSVDGKRIIDHDLTDLDFRERLFEIIFERLTYSKRQDKYITKFFYNLVYDWGCIFDLMPDKQQSELYMTGKTTYKNKQIMIADDFFSIRDMEKTKKRERKQWTYYDIAVFTKCSLEKAVESWLPKKYQKGGLENNLSTIEQHIERPVEADESLTGLVFNDIELLRKVYNDALHYAVNDAVVTANLAYEVRKHYENMNIPFDKPFSPASLTKAYIMNEELHYPTFDRVRMSENKMEEQENPESWKATMKAYQKMQKLCNDYFFGGLFEMVQRGYFPYAVSYDVNSQYPSAMLDLPSTDDLKMYEIRPNNLSFDDLVNEIKKSEMAVITMKVWIDDDAIMCPFPVVDYTETSTGKIIRPILKGAEITCTKDLFLFWLNKYPHRIKEIITGGYLFCSYGKEVRKPFAWLKDFYYQRQKIKNKYGDDDKRQDVLKQVMNSTFGITAESVKDMNTKIENGRPVENTDFNDGKPYYRAGKFARPIYAMHITERGRLQMLSFIFDNDLEDCFLGICTDAVLLDGDNPKVKALQESNHPDLDPEELGKFDLDKQGRLLIMGNGVYMFNYKEDGIYKTKMTTRGFNKNNFPDLFKEQEYKKWKNETDITVENKRPISWKEFAMRYTNDLNAYVPLNCGLFDDDNKDSDLNMDNSREWERPVKNLKDLFTCKIKSKPLKRY